ncbi:hypothetical protein TrRE_jg13093 [Triparma retinervis]|uniref:Uncharacterized protein n=1 Tax=Triparma retinervis TaxID=2557542 RepID=A0A9W6ZZE9_9STRA|nr:hypothetical protein TrRE_jg13093 [Triparma retinervis]
MHENGSKHKEKLQEKMKEKREKRKTDEKTRRDVNQAIRDMEQAASEAMGGGKGGGFFDPSMGGGSMGGGSMGGASMGGASMGGGGPNDSKTCQPVGGVDWNALREGEKEGWEKRKRDREEKNKSERKAKNNEDEVMRYKREGAGGGGKKEDKNGASEPSAEESPGHYTVAGVTYLEGTKFHPLFVVDDVEVQAFVGGEDGEWVDGLITGKEEKELSGTAGLVHRSFSFCYLPEDAEEEVEVEGLTGADVRIRLGAEGAPKDLEEAMLLMGGGERVTTFEVGEGTRDEDTGLGGWDVLEERVVTNEVWEREERERKERVETDRRIEEEMRAKEKERAEMEMKKFDGGDSALQSYNVFGGTGYKGVDIGQAGDGNTTGEKRVVEEGKKVGFKKKKRKKM